MGHFDLQFDEHAVHIASQPGSIHHLTLQELHLVQMEETPPSCWGLIPAAIGLFALGFSLVSVLFLILT